MKKLLGIVVLAGLFCMHVVFGAVAADGKALYAGCAGCHGPDGTGRSGPALKGQPADELTRKLDGYKAGTYGGEKKNIMEGAVKNRSAEDLKAIVEYIGTL